MSIPSVSALNLIRMQRILHWNHWKFLSGIPKRSFAFGPIFPVTAGKTSQLLIRTRKINFLKIVSISSSCRFFATPSINNSLPSDEFESRKAAPIKNQPKSVWKSSAKPLDSHTKMAVGQSETRDEVYHRLGLDTDLATIVTEEMLLFDLKNSTLYRIFFAFIVAQFFFWAFCANILYMFYSGVDKKGAPLHDRQAKNKATEKAEASFIRTWLNNITANLWQTLVQGFFVSIGTIFGVVCMYLLTRCVSFIRLMPGAKQVKIGRLNMFGFSSPNRYELLPLKDVTALEHRLQSVNYISLRVRGQKFSYLIDQQGTFFNEEIYDKTIGVQRNIRSKKSNH